jgi:hypothetical protein
LPQADAAQEGRYSFSGQGGHVIHSGYTGDTSALFQT